MCGIFGVLVTDIDEWGHAFIGDAIDVLAACSESRGKDSAGFAFRNEQSGQIAVLRAPLPISELKRREEYRRMLDTHAGPAAGPGRRAVIGHSRLVTNGSQLKDQNNQPVVKAGVVGVHNGIIVNDAELWADITVAQCAYDLDTEVLLALFRQYTSQGMASGPAMAAVLSRVFGTVSTGFFVDDRPELVLGTNNGSLYTLSDGHKALLFASERHTMTVVQAALAKYPGMVALQIAAVAPGTGVVVDVRTAAVTPLGGDAPAAAPPVTVPPLAVTVQAIDAPAGHRSLLVDFRDIAMNPNADRERSLLEHPADEIDALRRCTRCVLPETFPFIEFDGDGVCNYCRNYRLKNQPRPLDDLRRLVEPYRRRDGGHDCIVPFSGGRDSTFTVHMIKKVLGMNPIALTYDWGMVTDLARRNIARVCGRLGVENVIVAADIKTKRENIRMNIEAWLRRPSLGMIPLFMSGDKYFFYYTNQLKKQAGIQLNIWGINPLENTDFKTGFAGVPPRFNKKRIYSLGVGGQLRFFTYVGRNLVLNPAYFNSSNLDSLGSMASRYLYPQKDYFSLFDYYTWNEQEIEGVILGEYDWERAIDTRSTWRIGDGTASFYNYIYYTVAGFSENDTFRSNQIREGLLTRAEALPLVQEENRPRYENMKWYLDIVGVDFKRAVQVINRIPKRYRRR